MLSLIVWKWHDRIQRLKKNEEKIHTSSRKHIKRQLSSAGEHRTKRTLSTHFRYTKVKVCYCTDLLASLLDIQSLPDRTQFITNTKIADFRQTN